MKMRKIVTTVFGIMIVAVLALPANAWTGNNYHSTTNFYIGGELWRKGFVQIQPSTNDGGYHYAQGFIDYYSSYVGGGTVHTALGRSASDSRKYTKSYSLQVTNGDNTYTTSFSYRATKIADGSSYWPA